MHACTHLRVDLHHEARAAACECVGAVEGKVAMHELTGACERAAVERNVKRAVEDLG